MERHDFSNRNFSELSKSLYQKKFLVQKRTNQENNLSKSSKLRIRFWKDYFHSGPEFFDSVVRIFCFLNLPDILRENKKRFDTDIYLSGFL